MQQDSLFACDIQQQEHVAGPVTCLGKNFANDQARRDYFLDLLAEKLQDPEFRKIEGFPIGNDEDILNLSDPPYYTACPNPWIGDFVSEWKSLKPAGDEKYHREPFAADVSEGKNDPIYNAHSYHTKVPHKAIMRYILHYTNPGDIIFDGFCGSGMAGVAAQMCGDRELVASLGYQVTPEGVILQEEVDVNGNQVWKPFSRLGQRKAILNDLSPAATFIAYNYNTPTDVTAFEQESKRIIKEVEVECEWMYQTKHTDGRIGKINYTIWSDVFLCGECSQEIILWDVVDKTSGEVSSDFLCPECGSISTKRTAERAFTKTFDKSLNETIKQAKKVPVLINYSMSGKSYTKTPDQNDFELLNTIERSEIPTWFPSDRLMHGKETRRNDPIGITHSHHFYTKRNLWVFSSFLAKSQSSFWKNHLWGAAKDCQSYATKMIKINVKRLLFGGGQFMGFVGGTLYVPSLHGEQSTLKSITTKTKKITSNYRLGMDRKNVAIGVGSLGASDLYDDSSIDYIFLDPPFGSNINYSELNFLWESWLKIWTNIAPEAIENDAHNKSLTDYRYLMTKCFRKAYRVLKPGRWMTIEFSNTNAAVWNSIQTSLTDAGFIVANVSALDKKQGSFKAYTTPTAVKQDLIISAYKPNGGFEERFQMEAKTEDGIWDFVRTHLHYLPVIKQQLGIMQFIPERDPRILFDQMVAYYVRKGYPVPISSQEFQNGLSQRFIERDGMYFLPEQAAEYDRKKMASSELKQLTMFVTDEASAIQWLRQLIKERPQTFSDINPQFMQQLGGWSKNEVVLDLRELLRQNFLCYDGQDEVPDQIHSYLSSNWKELRNLPKNDPALVSKAKDRWYVPDPNKAGDLEKLREQSLLKEFEEYKAAKKKLKVFRIEAVRVGFKKFWEQQEFAALISVAEKLPSNVLEEDPVLLMYYDQAVTLNQVDADDEW